MRPMRPPRCRRPLRVSSGLRFHLDRVYRALFEAGAAAGTAAVVEAVTVPFAELDHRVLRAGTEAAAAFEAVAARQAAMSLGVGLLGGQPADDLAEVDHALIEFEF